MPPFAPSSDKSARQISRRKYLGKEERYLAIKSDIRAALAVVKAGESALATGDLGGADLSHDSAQESYSQILQQICASTEEDANSVEPIFTEFEDRLLALARSIGLLPRLRRHCC